MLGEYGVAQSRYFTGYDRSAYAVHLMGDRYRSPAARYARLTDDVNNDVTRMPAFFKLPGECLILIASAAGAWPISATSTPANVALSRMDENASIVEVVRTRLGERVSSYRFALERLVIMTPMPQAAEIERSLNHLAALVAHYQTHTAPTPVQEQSLASAR